jgi:hypothetical protein
MRLTSLRRSTPFRLALSFALLFILTVVATGGVMYHLLRNGLNTQLDTALNDTFQVVSSTYAPDEIEDLVTTLDSYANLKPADDGVYSLIDGSGKKLAGNFKTPILPEGVFTVKSAEIGLKGSTVYRLQTAKLGQNTLVVGRSFANGLHAEDRARQPHLGRGPGCPCGDWRGHFPCEPCPKTPGWRYPDDAGRVKRAVGKPDPIAKCR